MSFATIDALRESLARPQAKQHTPEYTAKMLHDVPKASVVNREAFILERVAGKRVLEFGASGALHEKIKAAAASYLGVDREASAGVVAFDLDAQNDGLPGTDRLHEVIVCGEVLEHLGNPLSFLARLHACFQDVPAIITVPNAFSEIGAGHMERGVENVNIDHVCWYSYRTLRTLLERVGYAIEAFHWYNGEPLTAEGLLVVVR